MILFFKIWASVGLFLMVLGVLLGIVGGLLNKPTIQNVGFAASLLGLGMSLLTLLMLFLGLLWGITQ